MAEADDRDLRSRTDARRERVTEETALKKLAERLVALKPRQLDKLELPEFLDDAVRFGQTITSPIALQRQIRLIRQHLRSMGRAADIEARLEAAREAPVRAAPSAPLHPEHVSLWLQRLVDEGHGALEALFSEHPSADRQALRHQLRAVMKARQSALGPNDRGVQRAEHKLCLTLSELLGAPGDVS